jgi:hypothetical protein
MWSILPALCCVVLCFRNGDGLLQYEEFTDLSRRNPVVVYP